MPSNRFEGLLAYALMMGAAAESQYSEEGIVSGKNTNNSQPSWKRKTCKSCIRCGERCSPYTYNGSILYRSSKPTSKACKDYKPKCK